MKGNGLLAVNFVGYVDGDGADDTRVVLRTLGSVFTYVVRV
jgi:hypothetical protein